VFVHERIGGAVAIAMILFASRPAGAQTCPSTEVAAGSVADSDVASRVEFVRAVLANEQRKASYWNWGWGVGFGVATAAQGAIALVSDDSDNQRKYGAGAIRSFVGAANQAIVPLRIPEMAANDASCDSLAAAEQALRDAAKNERKQLSWFPRVGSVLLNLSAGIYLVAVDQTTDAIVAVLVGLAVSELRFQTAPQGAVRALDSYRTGELAKRPTVSKWMWAVAPSAAGNPAGATFLLLW
jgi:hypothetical protein